MIRQPLNTDFGPFRNLLPSDTLLSTWHPRSPNLFNPPLNSLPHPLSHRPHPHQPIIIRMRMPDPCLHRLPHNFCHPQLCGPPHPTGALGKRAPQDGLFVRGRHPRVHGAHHASSVIPALLLTLAHGGATCGSRGGSISAHFGQDRVWDVDTRWFGWGLRGGSVSVMSGRQGLDLRTCTA
jgi:hypothetical protein